MQIIWHGHAFFQIIISQGKDEKLTIAIDPPSEDIGLRLPSIEADVLLTTHSHHDHNNIKAVSGKPFLIQGPGEYEIKGIFIQGIPAHHDKNSGKERGLITIYTIEAEEMRICHLADFGQKELTEEQLDKIGDCDILMIPVGGTYTISGQEATKIISQIEPKLVIPMHYQIPKLKIHPPTDEAHLKVGVKRRAPSGGGVKLEGVDKFLKAMGQKEILPQPKLSIRKKDLSEEETKIVVLKP